MLREFFRSHRLTTMGTSTLLEPGPEAHASAPLLYGAPEEAIRASLREASSPAGSAVADPLHLDYRRMPRMLSTIPIRVFASDCNGRQFIEDTVTAVVSGTGARICLSQSLLPDDTILIRNIRTGIEEEFRVVGTCQPVFGVRQEWGVEMLNPAGDIWGFASVSTAQPSEFGISIQCGGCQATEQALLSSIEHDVLASTGLISRYCPRCDETARWRPAGLDTLPDSNQTPGSSAAPALADRRGCPRVRVDMRIRVRNLDGLSDLVHTRDASRSGLQFKSHKNFRTGDKVLITLANDDSRLHEKQGKIVWSNETIGGHLYGVGYTK